MSVKFVATGNVLTIDIAGLVVRATKLGVDIQQLFKDLFKLGTDAVTTALDLYEDYKAGNYLKVLTDLIAMAPADAADVIAVLQDIGLAVATP